MQLFVVKECSYQNLVTCFVIHKELFDEKEKNFTFIHSPKNIFSSISKMNALERISHEIVPTSLDRRSKEFFFVFSVEFRLKYSFFFNGESNFFISRDYE